MSRKMLSFNSKRCLACYGCEVACKVHHNRSSGPKWIEVVTVGPVDMDGRLCMDVIPMTCRHCEDPVCMAVCPIKGAIYQRPDGVVLLNSGLCIGCKLCIQTCPFGAMQFNQESGTAEKCDLCVDRIDRGLDPFCAANCFGKCIEFKETTELATDKRTAIAARIQESLLNRKEEK